MILDVSYAILKSILLSASRARLTPYFVPSDIGSPSACAVSGVGPGAVLFVSTLTPAALADFNATFPSAGQIVSPNDVLAAAVAGIDVATYAKARFTIAMGYLDVNPLPAPLTMVTAVWIPADTSAVRIRMNNNDVTGVVGNGPDVTGVGLAIGASNGSYGYADTPNVIDDGSSPGITVPGDGADDYVTDWLVPQRGTDGKMLVVFSIPSGGHIKTNAAAAVLYNGKRSQTVAQVNPLPTLIDSGSTAFTVRVEVQRTAAPRIVAIGDSLTIGYGIASNPGLETTYGYLLGPNKGWAVDVCGVPGATNADWNDTGRPFSDGMLLGGAVALSDLSINDLPLLTGANNNAKRDDFLVRVATRSAQMKAAGAKAFVQMTLAQNAAYTAQDAIRVLINEALIGSAQTGVDKVVDSATLIASMTDPLLSDGTHWKATTHVAVSDLVASVLQSVL